MTDTYDDEPDPLRRLGIYLELAEAPHVERALAAMVSLRGTEHHEAARHAWHVIRALEARAERAEARLATEQSDAIAARKRVRDLIEDFNRQVQRTEEERAAYEARLSVMESDLTAAREEGARMALEAAAQMVDCGCEQAQKAAAVAAEAPNGGPRWMACGEANCGAIEAAAIRALDPAQIVKGSTE